LAASDDDIDCIHATGTPNRMIDFDSYRPLLFSIAYRMLGAAMDAEDMVQEAYLRAQAVDATTVENVRAYLCTIVTRLCLDHLKAARSQREQYIGMWLPEPILTGADTLWSSPEAAVGDKESLSMGFMVLLEQLSAEERAVFVLREAFDYDYREIAGVLQRSEAACRQLFHRARQHIADQQRPSEGDPTARQEIIVRFLSSLQTGDVPGVLSLLREDVRTVADGGGKVKGAALRPILGREAVSRLLLSLVARTPPQTTFRFMELNGSPSLLILVDGQLFSAMVFLMDAEGIYQICNVLNPDKLRRLDAEIGSNSVDQ
jgi:RNA polymerase sigma-70 factor, ECF subfamily